MMITCPRCQSRYRVAGQDFQQEPARTVRCAACQHVWVYANETLPSRPLEPTAPSTPPSAVQEATPTISFVPTLTIQRTWVIWAGWALLFAAFSSLATGYTLYKQKLTALWPPLVQLESLFHHKDTIKPLQILELGHHVYLSPTGRQMVVTGVIENTTPYILSLPALFMTLEGPHMATSAPTPVDIQQKTLEPKERIFFECPGIPVPPPGATVLLTFKKVM